LFTGAKDPVRPFKVRVGDATIVAIGTEFDVQRASDRTIVSVTEGRVNSLTGSCCAGVDSGPAQHTFTVAAAAVG
jgi:transmembrane sensor